MVEKQYNNERWKLPAPEDMKYGFLYSFTFNPKVDAGELKLDFVGTNKVDEFILSINVIISKLGHCLVSAHPEVSKLGKLHLHGWIIIKNIDFYIWDVPYMMENGTFEIDEIKDWFWSIYCTKQDYLIEKKFGKAYNIRNFKNSQLDEIAELI